MARAALTAVLLRCAEVEDAGGENGAGGCRGRPSSEKKNGFMFLLMVLSMFLSIVQVYIVWRSDMSSGVGNRPAGS